MRRIHTTWLQIVSNVAALVPLALIMWDYTQDQLTVNPIQEITFRTGKTALILLILTLACTPVNIIFGFKQVIALRRTLGLYAFLYVCLHFLTFVGLDYGFDLGQILATIREKRYVLVGFTAFLLLLPLACTSTRGWMRRLGKQWRRLHRLIYIVAPLAVLHFVWLVKTDIREPLLYGTVVALLLLVRTPGVRRMLTGARNRLKLRARLEIPPRYALLYRQPPEEHEGQS